jgi:site-specific DNA recombinase
MSNDVRAACYAKFSSDKQSPLSIDDQVRKCREYAQRQGWEILDEHIYSDAGISGATAQRDGLKQLLAAAKAKSFQVVLIDDTSRLSRKLSDSLNLSEQLRFAGVRLIFCSQGIDSDSEQSEVLLATHGIVDSLFIRELASETRRGLEGRVLKSQHHGGHIFGYRSVPIEDASRRDNYGRPLVVGAKLAVDEGQAKIIRRIFTLYADGLSIKAVTKQLNREHIESPRPRPGRQQSWAPSSVRHVLQNERYRGIVTYGRTKKIRNPATGKRVYKHQPAAAWIRVESPEQRIVSDELFARVQARLAFVNQVYGDRRGRRPGLLRARAASSRYLFSGFLRCGECGGAVTIVSGAGRRHRAADYGCPAREFRVTCTNTRRISSDVLESQLLEKLQREVLAPEAIDYVFRRLEVELAKQLTRIDSNLENMRRRKAELEGELENLTRAVASGLDSASIRKGIAEREAEISALTARVLGRKKDSVRNQIRDLRKFVMASVGDFRALISANDSAAATRMELAKHVKEIVLSPGDGDEIKYTGKWDLLGDGGNMDGAEGQNRTGYAGLFRAALYR